jgi:hypothetical protein
VGEVINGEIRLLGINGGIRLLGINEGDLREEDKKEGEDLEEASYFCLRISEFQKGEEEEEIGEMVFGKLSQGTGVAGNFGLGGQETARIPGAREPERLFLVGWEVNIQSGQEQEQDQTRKGTR